MSAAPVPLRWMLTLAGLSALASLSTNILLPALPVLARDLGAGDAAATGVLSLFLAVFALAQLVVGPLSDRLGRRPVVQGGLAVFGVGTLICAAAPDLPVLLAGRAVQAMGVAAASVLARAAARDRFEGPALAALLGRIMVVMAAAPGFSPLLGGLVQQAWGWRATFGVLLLAGLGLATAYAGIVGETLPSARRRHLAVPDLARGYLALLGDGRFMRPAVAAAAILGALFAYFGAAPVVLVRDHGFTALQVGFFFAGTVFIVFAAGSVAPRWTASAGAAAVLQRGSLLAGLGGLLMGLTASNSLAGFIASTCVFLFGMGLVNPVGTALALTPFAANAGQASALLGFLQMAAAASLTTAAATLPGSRVATLAVVLIAAALLALAVGRKAPTAASRHPA